MTSWVYAFSKFTSEALLFEALIIFTLCAGYAAFYVLRKRRHGVIEAEVPAGVVRSYLNALIVEAEQLRMQLFGILSSAGVEVPANANFASLLAASQAASVASGGLAAGLANDPALTQKMALLEQKMAEQAQAMSSVLADKTRIEKELNQARAGGAPAEAAGASNAATADLQAKIQSLENKLSEYSVIEDDLANLKRLQQENAQLKTALAAQGGTVPAPVATTAAAPAPVAAAPAEPKVAAPAAPEPAPAPKAEPVAAAAPEPIAAATSPSFEGLVDQVEKSLETAAAPAETAATAPPASTSAPTPDKIVKSDADLLAEFEKMLNT